MAHSSILLTSIHLELLANIIRTEFDVSPDDEYCWSLIDLAAALELYELADEMKKDLLIS